MTEKGNGNKLMQKMVLWLIVAIWGIVTMVGGFFGKTTFDSLKAEDKRICTELDKEKVKTDGIKEDISDIKAEQKVQKVYLDLILQAQGVSKIEIKKALDTLKNNDD